MRLSFPSFTYYCSILVVLCTTSRCILYAHFFLFFFAPFRSLRYLSTEHGYKALSLVATLSATAFGNSLILAVITAQLDMLVLIRTCEQTGHVTPSAMKLKIRRALSTFCVLSHYFPLNKTVQVYSYMRHQTAKELMKSDDVSFRLLDIAIAQVKYDFTVNL